MTEQPISIQLTMARTPANPVAKAHFDERFGLSAFNLTRLVQQAGMLLLVGLFSFLIYQVISHFFLKSVKIVGVSMVPTLQENNHYLVNLWTFHNQSPQHNDIVVIRDPGDHGLSVKRIIAVEGESVHFKDGKVFVNGVQLSEPYLLPKTMTFTYSQAKEQFITCGKEQYFVLGDNRFRSIDSRAYGPVSRAGILGLVKVQ